MVRRERQYLLVRRERQLWIERYLLMRKRIKNAFLSSGSLYVRVELVQLWNQISGVSFIQCGSTTDLRLFINWSRSEVWVVWNCYRNTFMGWFSSSVLSSWHVGVMSNIRFCFIDISQPVLSPVKVKRERCLQTSIQDRWHTVQNNVFHIRDTILNRSKKRKEASSVMSSLSTFKNKRWICDWLTLKSSQACIS